MLPYPSYGTTSSKPAPGCLALAKERCLYNTFSLCSYTSSTFRSLPLCYHCPPVIKHSLGSATEAIPCSTSPVLHRLDRGERGLCTQIAASANPFVVFLPPTDEIKSPTSCFSHILLNQSTTRTVINMHQTDGN